jgi:hypothetical protein
MEDCEELSVHCLDTGTFVRFVLTEAEGGTFVDGEAGMEPPSVKHRVWDVVAGKRWYRDGRSWTRTRDLVLIRDAL